MTDGPMTPSATQAARDAAAGLIAVPANAEAMRRGERDDHAFVLAFAKAIAEERERAARIAENPEAINNSVTYAEGDSLATTVAKSIATAIRATVGEVGK